jgi:hypothetical protein
MVLVITSPCLDPLHDHRFEFENVLNRLSCRVARKLCSQACSPAGKVAIFVGTNRSNTWGTVERAWTRMRLPRASKGHLKET